MTVRSWSQFPGTLCKGARSVTIQIQRHEEAMQIEIGETRVVCEVDDLLEALARLGLLETESPQPQQQRVISLGFETMTAGGSDDGDEAKRGWRG